MRDTTCEFPYQVSCFLSAVKPGHGCIVRIYRNTGYYKERSWKPFSSDRPHASGNAKLNSGWLKPRTWEARNWAQWHAIRRTWKVFSYTLKSRCRLWTNMTDKDFEVLQTALSPEVSESEDQVCMPCLWSASVFSSQYQYIVKKTGNEDNKVVKYGVPFYHSTVLLLGHLVTLPSLCFRAGKKSQTRPLRTFCGPV